MASRPDEPVSAAPGGGPLTAAAELPPTAVDEAVREAEDKKWTPAKIAM